MICDLARAEYFISVSDALDVKIRTDSVNDKITYAAEVRCVVPIPLFIVNCNRNL